MRAAIERRHGQLKPEKSARYDVTEASNSPCWMCRGDDLGAQDGAARAALCDAHLRSRVRVLMGLNA